MATYCKGGKRRWTRFKWSHIHHPCFLWSTNCCSEFRCSLRPVHECVVVGSLKERRKEIRCILLINKFWVITVCIIMGPETSSHHRHDDYERTYIRINTILKLQYFIQLIRYKYYLTTGNYYQIILDLSLSVLC